MNSTFGLFGFLGVDSPDLVSPTVEAREAIDAYRESQKAFDRAQRRYDGLVAGLTQDQLADPSPALARRLDRFEARFDRTIIPHQEAERRAIAAILACGAGVNRGGVRHGGRIYAVVRDDEAPEPAVVVVELSAVVDLG